VGTALRVLLVEDDADQRRLVTSMLERAGHTVTLAAERGDDPAILTADIDVALIDLNLPGKGGAELIRALLDRQPRLPVLVVSASSDGAAVSEALLAGALGYVVKGARPSEVVDAVELVARRTPTFSPEVKAVLHASRTDGVEKAMARLRKFL
jgi:DNA-binding NarL/FixJ family response regulator